MFAPLHTSSPVPCRASEVGPCRRCRERLEEGPKRSVRLCRATSSIPIRAKKKHRNDDDDDDDEDDDINDDETTRTRTTSEKEKQTEDVRDGGEFLRRFTLDPPSCALREEER